MLVARVDALRAEPEVEVDAGTEARMLLEQRHHQLLGGARVGRRLEDDTVAGPEDAERAPSRRSRRRSGRVAPSRSGVGTVMTAMSNVPIVGDGLDDVEAL